VLVQFDSMGAVGRITLARPQVGNAVSPPLIADLAAAIDAAEAAPCRAVLIAAEGANFCVGADLKYLEAAGARLAAELERMANEFHAALVKLCAMKVPIVVAARGMVIGGGFGLALASDFLICPADARFSTGYTRLGLSADAGVSFFLTRAVGVRRARSLLIDPRFIEPNELVALGIAERIVPADELDARALAFATELASGPTAAIGAIKRLTQAAIEGELRAHLDRETREIVMLARRPDVLAAIQATLARQEAVFSG
jgi:2-(1,2-epoxy-1,2-dihydrophenyl)acetyl-CoA isomerase